MQRDRRFLQSQLGAEELEGLFDADVTALQEPPGVLAALTDMRAKRLIKEAYPSSKFTKCIAIVDELVRAGKPAVVWCFFRQSMFAIAQELKSKGVSAQVVCGATDGDERTRILESFKAGEVHVFIANPQTLAESISLHTVCHDAVFFEYGYNLVYLLQSKDRIHRLGLPPEQYTQYRFIRLTYELDDEDWSLDHNIYDRLKEKEERMLNTTDKGVLESGSTDESDLAKVFSGLFDTNSHKELLSHPRRCVKPCGTCKASRNKAFVRCFHVVLVYHGVHERGFDFRMTKQALHLLNRHAFINGARGKRATKFMRMHATDSQLPA